MAASTWQQVSDTVLSEFANLSAAIGVAAGMGRESMAVLNTLLALAIFAVIPLVASLLEISQPVAAAEPPLKKPAVR